jgi:type IV secretory pathway TrbL component
VTLSEANGGAGALATMGGGGAAAETTDAGATGGRDGAGGWSRQVAEEQAVQAIASTDRALIAWAEGRGGRARRQAARKGC